MQVVKSSRDEYLKELDAKNAELSQVMTKAREEVDNMQQDLERITGDKVKLENECAELQKNNTVSTYACIRMYSCHEV